MSEASLFMPKKRDRERRNAANRQARTGPPAAGPSSSSIAGTTLPRQQVGPPMPTLPIASGSRSTKSASGSGSGSGSTETKPNPHLTEIKLYSTDPASRSRSSIIKFMSARDFTPEQITKPILMNRKQPGPRELPIHALDDEGKIVGKYMYDDTGKPMLAPNGQPYIEKKDVGLDPDMIGGAPGQKRKLRKGVKEVFHQDLDIIRMKREEVLPWVLETAKPRPEGQTQSLGHVPEHWVGRMTEASSLPTVLLINDGRLESGFEVVPLGRTYRFTPERPFKTLDADAANKLFEHQMKHKVHDRWSQRPDGPALMGNLGGPSNVKTERDDMANRWETRMRGPQPTRVKVEKYEDDFKREGRQQERGMEGGIDEELDYDVTEEFQDDDENNTFYHDQEEEEDTKLQEEQIKKEQRLANATFGDRSQIANPDDEDDDDLFGDGKLNSEGRRLRKMMRKRGEGEDYDSSDSDDSDSDETIRDDKSEKSVKDDKDKGKEKEKEKETEKDKERSAPGSAERPSRPPSRGPAQRQTTSPGGGGKRPNHPAMHGKAGTAPPGSGAAFLAQRATGSRGASPKARSRGNSPHNSRATSPESRDGRGMSPPSRGSSPSRALSPPLGGSGREGSPSGSTPGSGSSATNAQRPSGGKRKTATASPQPQPSSQGGSSNNSPKRKPSPTPSNGSSSEPRSKKKKSSTPDVAPFANQINQQEVIAWFLSQPGNEVAMSVTIKAFAPKLKSTPAEYRTVNQNLFMKWVGEVTTKEGGKLILKPEYRR